MCRLSIQVAVLSHQASTRFGVNRRSVLTLRGVLLALLGGVGRVAAIGSLLLATVVALLGALAVATALAAVLLLVAALATILLAAAVAATLVATTALVTAAAATPATTAALTEAAAAAAAGAVGRLINTDSAAVKFLAVHVGDSALGISLVAVTDEAEATAATSVAVLDNNGLLNSAELLELGTEHVIIRVPGQAADEKLSHFC